MKPVTGSLFLALALSVSNTCAGEIRDAAEEAENFLSNDKPVQAFKSVSVAANLVWEQIPLSVQKAILVAADPQGFGIYEIRDTNEYKATDPLVIYTEPVGFAYGRDGDLYTIDMQLDFDIKDMGGGSIASQKNFSAWQLRSRVQNREFMGKITYNFQAIPAGDYVVTTTVRDQNSPETTSFDVPFKIVP